jgi:hypothetical protein
VDSRQSDRIRVGTNAVEGYKASMDGNGLRVLNHLPRIIERGMAFSLLLKKNC